jgi:hypothetical protein
MNPSLARFRAIRLASNCFIFSNLDVWRWMQSASNSSQPKFSGIREFCRESAGSNAARAANNPEKLRVFMKTERFEQGIPTSRSGKNSGLSATTRSGFGSVAQIESNRIVNNTDFSIRLHETSVLPVIRPLRIKDLETRRAALRHYSIVATSCSQGNLTNGRRFEGEMACQILATPPKSLRPIEIRQSLKRWVCSHRETSPGCFPGQLSRRSSRWIERVLPSVLG